MAYTFREVIDQCADEMGIKYDTLAWQQKMRVRAAVNDAYATVWRAEIWPWRIAETVINTPDEIDTGTVSITQGSATLTFSSSVLSSAIQANPTRYKVIIGNRSYRFATASSGTAGTSEAYIPDTTDTEATYSIHQARYELPHRFLDIPSNGVKPYNSGSIRHCSYREFNDSFRNASNTGVPTCYCLWGQTSSTYYSTGTVTISGATVTLATGTWPSDAAGMVLRIPVVSSSSINYSDAYEYEISSRTSDSVVVLARNYCNPFTFLTTLTTGTAYQLKPAGTWLIEFYPLPDGGDTAGFPVYINYGKEYDKMLADSDVVYEMPDEWHDAALYLAIYNSTIRDSVKKETSRQIWYQRYVEKMDECSRKAFRSEDFQNQWIPDSNWLSKSQGKIRGNHW